MTTAKSCPFAEGFDFTDPDVVVKGLPREEFAWLRETSPVWWNKQPRRKSGFDDEGYWVVTKHADIKEISKRNDLFSNNANTAVIRFNEDISDDEIEMQKHTILLNLDAPQHTKVRKLISKGFTPRAVAALEESLAARAKKIVADAAAKGSGDFVTDVAMELPLQAIADLLGVPSEDRHKLFDWSNQMLGYDDPTYDVDSTVAAAEILNYAQAMAQERLDEPREDIVSELVHADIDGEALTADEFGFFVILLAVAGNETTRNAITHGMAAFMDNPDQWELFKKERPTTTADEVVRWATPVIVFQRTALEDYDLSGAHIKKGDRIGMFYASANFDEDVFDEPNKFNILRDPNPHLGFGGHGAHYCVGANLARLEINLMLNAIADAMPNIHRADGEVKRFRSAWIHGITELPVEYS